MIKVLHYVSGSFTGATHVAINVLQACEQEACENILVLSQKRAAFADNILQLQQTGMRVEVLVGRQRWLKFVKFFAILRRENPDVVICHGYSEHLWGRYAALLAGTQGIIHVEHSAAEPYKNFRIKELRWLTRRSNVVICCSKPVEKRLRALGCDATKCITIANGIDLRPYHPERPLAFNKKHNNLVMVARFVKRKDHQTLLEAMSILVANNYSGKLYLAGDGDARLIQHYKTQVSDLGLAQHVEFLGNIDSVADLLLRNQIFVLCSHIEGMPLSICEAMAAGCVVVASDIEGVRDTINHKQDGILVTPKNPQALAQALLNLQRHPQQKNLLAQAARKRALQEFGSQKMLAQYVEQIKKTCP